MSNFYYNKSNDLKNLRRVCEALGQKMRCDAGSGVAADSATTTTTSTIGAGTGSIAIMTIVRIKVRCAE